ncbi:MAG: NADP(H)-dependent aldo-keto reductase [Gammaproteobacteria bacterium]|nr:NADP(H)-dependent aldo-keto reductase [Gammaproteobacteria bacterium]
MKTLRLANSDLNVSTICLGTMTYGQQNTETQAHDQLHYAISQGINFIDAAEMYPVPPRAETTGLTERYIGTWLKQQHRDQIILATKATGPGRTLTWIREGELHFTQANLHKALTGSLQRLQTDYVDLYQLHWPDRNVPMFGQYHFKPDNEHETVSLLETMQALAGFIKAGKIRYWGLSNETPWGLMTVLKLADQHNLPRPISVQNAYNLINRSWENGLSEIGYRENIPLLAYSPLAFGLLTGKYLTNTKAPGRVNLFPGFAQRYSKPNTQPAVAAYAKLAQQHALTPTQLALTFCYQRWCVGSTIIGATSLEQLKENIAAKAVTLSPDVLAEIEQIHLRFTNPAP